MSSPSLGARAVIAASSVARKMGAALDRAGARIEIAKYPEKLVPSTRFVAVDDIAPVVSENASFVAPSASVIGDVSLGDESSVWYGATVRGDVHKISIGNNSSIGDRAVVHVAKIQGDFPTSIGNNVTVGPCAVVHASTLQDSVVIGASAQVLDGSTVETNAIVAPGSVVTPGTTVKAGTLWAGAPAKQIRDLTEDEIASILEMASDTTEMAKMHAVENNKDYFAVAADEEAIWDAARRSDEFKIPEGEPVMYYPVTAQGAPGMIFNSSLTHPEEGLKIWQKQEQEEAAKKAAAAKK